MGILIEKIRICGFRGIENLELDLCNTAVVTGMNNSSKTSLLKALQLVLGNRQFITNDDFHIAELKRSEKIIIDVKIVPVKMDGTVDDVFDEKWESLFTDERIIIDTLGKQIVPIRTIINIDPLKSNFITKQYILPEWTEYKTGEDYWYSSKNGKEKSFHFDEIPFFYVDAQRDIVEDMKLRTSYLGKMLSNIKYSKEDITSIEEKIKELNEHAVSSSDVLTSIETNLKGLDSAMDSSAQGVDISPFPKKVRDLNKGVSIQYSDFSMEYHGMGTRSWSSLLTLKSFVSFFEKLANESEQAFFPILAIEEPEAHLHPNAQKKLYKQISDIPGQKIVSTHSNFIVASAELKEIRNFYKESETIKCGKLDVSIYTPEDLRKISRQVVNNRGELFFSKVLVFFEGETEEQAIPIFAEKYYKCKPFELGIDFIGVSGGGNYLPFLRIAKNFNIPWFIFSDGEDEIKKKIKKDLKEVFNIEEIDLSKIDNVIILPNGMNFEKYLIESDYMDEIILAFEKLHSKDYLIEQIKKKDGTIKNRIETKAKCDKCKQSIYENIFRDYKGDEGFKSALYDCITSQKTQFGPVLAEVINESKKELPEHIVDIFEKIKTKILL